MSQEDDLTEIKNNLLGVKSGLDKAIDDINKLHGSEQKMANVMFL